jgi:hypothetical protein
MGKSSKVRGGVVKTRGHVAESAAGYRRQNWRFWETEVSTTQDVKAVPMSCLKKEVTQFFLF